MRDQEIFNLIARAEAAEQRAEAAEKALSQSQFAIQLFVDWCKTPDPVVPPEVIEAQHDALLPTCGQDYVHRSELDKLKNEHDLRIVGAVVDSRRFDQLKVQLNAMREVVRSAQQECAAMSARLVEAHNAVMKVNEL